MPLPPGRGTCSIHGCQRDIFTNRGWCQMHYQRWRTHGDATWEPAPRDTCSVDGCNEPVVAKGLCRPDYHRSLYRERRLRTGHPEPAPLIRPCDMCGTEYRRIRRSRFCSDECRRSSRALYYLLRDYGLTPEAYYELLDQQNHVCAICGGSDEVKGILSVDHCHETNRVRGLLCHRCNVGLGHFRDDPALLARAAQYVGTD